MNKIVVLKTASETVENTKFLYQLSQNYPSPCGKAGGVCLPGSTIYIDINSLAFQPRLGVWHPICTKGLCPQVLVHWPEGQAYVASARAGKNQILASS